MRTFRFASLLLAAAAAFLTPAAPHASDDAWVEIRYGTDNRLHELGGRFQHLDVDRKAGVARTIASAHDVASLRDAGYRVTVDRAATARMLEFFGNVGDKAIPNFACYRTVEETYSTMDTLAARHPALARVVDIGPSWAKSRNAAQGYPVRALVLGNTATDAAIPDKATMVVTSAIHAREYATAELMTRFAEGLLASYGFDDESTWLLDNFRFHLVLVMNPDGRKRAEGGVLWRKNVNTTNGATCSGPGLHVGVDLNRNFPYLWAGTSTGSSGAACQETYRGPSAASEPETQNVLRYVAGTRGADGNFSGGLLPDRRTTDAGPSDYRGLFVDVHAYGPQVMWPWGDRAAPAPNGESLRALGRRLAFLNNSVPQQLIDLYVTDGTMVDTMYGELGAPTILYEIGTEFFQSCTQFESTILPRNLASLRFAARTLDAPYELGNGPIADFLRASPTEVVAGEPVSVQASIDDRQFSNAKGEETSHVIESATAYVDLPPWRDGATAIPMRPFVGTFDTVAEGAIVEIDTTGLAPGVHTVYVQGRDASGSRGAPAAVRFRVTARPVAPQTGWYWNAAEPGRGFFVGRNAEGRVFMGTFHYLGDGSATWFSGQGAIADGAFASPIATFGNGQTLTGPYRAPSALAASGQVALQYSSDTHAQLTWPPGGVALARFPFTGGASVEPPQAGAPESGWWWNAQEPGRGFAMEFQGTSLFVAGFMYAGDGSATWYATTGTMQTSSRYVGTWLAFRDGQAAGATYSAPVRAPDAGSVTLEFQDARNARLTLPDGRVVALTRFGF